MGIGEGSGPAGFKAEMSIPLDRLLTPDEVARTLAVTRRRVYTLKDSGLLPGVRIGRSLRFRGIDVLELLERSRDDFDEWRG
jgi:excisionase family DNA binding protein